LNTKKQRKRVGAEVPPHETPPAKIPSSSFQFRSTPDKTLTPISSVRRNLSPLPLKYIHNEAILERKNAEWGPQMRTPGSANKRVAAPAELYDIKRYRKTKQIDKQIDDKQPKGEEAAFCDSPVWQRLVCIVAEFGINGRIMTTRFIDGPEIWMRLKVILTFVGSQLAISDKGTVYLAFGNAKIIGVCVAVPLKEARSCSTELLDPVKVR
jgi:hypothetical protein